MTALPDGTPVADALVWVAGAENMGRTGARGRVQLDQPLAPGEQTLVVSPADRAAYKESRYRVTVAAGQPAAYDLAVSPDRPLTFVNGREVATPPFSPAPLRVAPDKIRSVEAFRQVHALRGAHSAWFDGEAQDEGFWEPFIVWASRDPQRPAIGTYLLNGGGRWHVVYDCPRPIGLLTITGIDETGLLISFTSASGVTGTFHLLTHAWQFD